MVWVSFCITEIKIEKTVEGKNQLKGDMRVLCKILTIQGTIRHCSSHKNKEASNEISF